MTGNASCQQFGVDAMMMGSGCFVSSSTVAADAATLPEYAPHDDGSLFGLGGFSADVDDGTALAGQLQLAPQSVYGYGASPSDVTVALPPAATAKLAGDPNRGCWVQVQEQYYCPPACLSGDPFTTAARELSLRLAAESSSTGGTGVSSLPDQSSDVSCSGVTHASSGLVFQQPPAYGVEQQGERPHFSEVLSRSGYAHIVQQTLDEFVGCLLQDVAGATGGSVAGEPSCCPLPSSSSSITTPSSYQSMVFASSEDHPPHHNLRDDLLKLLQLMDQRCNQCLDEMQSAACKYGSMVRPGALSAPFAHRAVAATHRRLRARIVAEIAAATRTTQRGRDQCSSLADRERSWESAFIEKHWALRQLRRGDQQSWRPQRGLPEKSVAVLKAWMFENFLRPYPKDNEKEMLAARSGLSRSQVSNWFINARVRLWKPMIEEMYEDLKKASVGDCEGVRV
ncbi:hypothetical protein PR202_gb27708 [Eleusine coracana subsp. coracana]|uniref:Homeobox domain-containing protein n=1 Tax=Eleusine coracana subsp. coracana TaxID=191504 RepID=A0AAV5FV52_ELECO|nr:hypothetical protein PR202_gb27708 [Eleusine coracana subsp. coracana]